MGDEVTITGDSFTVMLSCFEVDPPAFVALAVNAKTPDVVGIPLMTPVELARESPAGSAPPETTHAIGVVPVAVSAAV